jgi:hypothetical protein
VSWGLPDATGIKTEFSYQTADKLDYDRRGQGGFFFWAPPKKSDAGAPTIYLTTFTDKNGALLTGDRIYRLNVPPNVPAKHQDGRDKISLRCRADEIAPSRSRPLD